MRTEYIDYEVDDKSFRGYIAIDDQEENQKFPAVLVAHPWMGLDRFSRQKAEELAKLGYIGFAADLYGDGITATNEKEAADLMKPLFLDRKQLRKRIVAAYTTLSQHPNVDPTQISAIGFCFGGLTVLELLRSGQNLLGVIVFHGVLGNTLGDIKADIEPNAKQINGHLLILHGYKDPLVSQQDLVSIQEEFSQANIDWQLYIYGDAAHAFTNPDAHFPSLGLIYHPRTKERAWLAMQNFLSELHKNHL